VIDVPTVGGGLGGTHSLQAVFGGSRIGNERGKGGLIQEQALYEFGMLRRHGQGDRPAIGPAYDRDGVQSQRANEGGQVVGMGLYREVPPVIRPRRQSEVTLGQCNHPVSLGDVLAMSVPDATIRNAAVHEHDGLTIALVYIGKRGPIYPCPFRHHRPKLLRQNRRFC
jgi:hypothetical protein